MREDTRAETEGLVEVPLSPIVMAELEFSGAVAIEVGIQQPEGVKIGEMVTTNLVGANQKLDLRVSRICHQANVR